MLNDITPMLAVRAEKAFDHPDWIFEIKWDGYRGIAEVQGGSVRLYSRNHLSLKERFPSIADQIEATLAKTGSRSEGSTFHPINTKSVDWLDRVHNPIRFTEIMNRFPTGRDSSVVVYDDHATWRYFSI